MPVYSGNRPAGSAGDVMAAVITDWFFRIPAVRVAEARFGSGSGRTWMYRFDYPSPAANYGLGSCHGAEIPFVFDTLGLPSVRPRLGASPSQAVADRVHQVWVSFVSSGSPGWAAYGGERRTTGLLAEELSVVEDPAGDERAVWEGIRLLGAGLPGLDAGPAGRTEVGSGPNEIYARFRDIFAKLGCFDISLGLACAYGSDRLPGAILRPSRDGGTGGSVKTRGSHA